jgi:hypothetical protein
MSTKTEERTYEAPALVEIGGFAELTRGLPWGCPNDLLWYNTPLAC